MLLEVVSGRVTAPVSSFNRFQLSQIHNINFEHTLKTTKTKMTTVDSLPYYDRDLDVVPNLRQRVEREIDQEIKTQQQSSKQSPHPFLEQFPDLSITPTTPKKDIYHDLLHISLPRLTNSTPTSGPDQTTGLDLDRLNIPYPADPTDLEAWEQAFSNAKAQLEQQRLRLLNLNLIGQYGPNHWKLSNFLIEKEIAKLELALEHATAEIDGVNRRRKANQTDVGDQLNDLAQKWQNLISTNISVEIVNLNLRAKVQQLRAEEEELKKKLETS